MYKKILIIYILFIFSVTAFAKEFVICKDYYSINEAEKEKKEKYLEKLLQKDPQNIECMLKLASVYLRTGKVSLAFDLITYAYNQNPEFVKNANISKILDLALRMSSLKKRATKTKDFTLWNELADTYFDIGLFKEAANAYKNSLKINNNQTDKKILLAVCYGNMQKYKKAGEVLKEVLQQQSNNFYANYYYAKLLKNEFEDRAWIKYMKNAKRLIEMKIATFSSEEEKEYITEDIKNELKN